VRVGVLGQGSIGQRHARNLRSLGHEVSTYDPKRDSETCSEEELVAGADAVVVASPTSEHARQARASLEASVPALVEKPLAVDAADAEALAKLAEERELTLGVAMNLRFHPGVRAVRDALQEAGRPLRAAVWCGSWLPGWRPGTDYREAYSARRELGGGVLLDCVHELDYLTWLLGPVASVSALLAHVSDLELDVEDVAVLQLQLRSGTVATVSLDYLDRDYHRGCRIVGSECTIAWDWAAERVRIGERGLSVPADVAPTYVAELEDFLEAVARGAAPAAPAASAAHVLQVVGAARQSAAEGRSVEVEGA
jgi:predicted dehydrogenase